MRVHPVVAATLAAVLVACAPAREVSTGTVEVGGVLEFHVEVADTGQSRREGLSGRDSLSEGTGMLFPFENRQERQVWMAGMRFPIDVAWVLDGQVLAVETLEPCTLADQTDCPSWTSPGDVDALLEVPAGALDSIEAGTPVEIVRAP